MERLTRRAQFLAVGRGARVVRQGFVLQGLAAAPENADGPPRFGFTVTKKIGNAVVRNRIRRRLRAAARAAEVRRRFNADYVLIGRTAALTLTFERLVTDLIDGMTAIAGEGRRTTGRIDG